MHELAEVEACTCLGCLGRNMRETLRKLVVWWLCEEQEDVAMVRVWRRPGSNIRRGIVRCMVQIIVRNEATTSLLMMISICTVEGKMRLIPVQYYRLSPSIGHDNVRIQRKHNVMILAAQAVGAYFWH